MSANEIIQEVIPTKPLSNETLVSPVTDGNLSNQESVSSVDKSNPVVSSVSENGVNDLLNSVVSSNQAILGMLQSQESNDSLSSNSMNSVTAIPSVSQNIIYMLPDEVSANTLPTYDSREEFEASSLQVDLYQYTILNRLEFIQYALCILIALLFLTLFLKQK